MAENFGFLNEVTSDVQTGIKTGLKKFEQQSTDLSSILSNVNTQVQATDKKKRDSDLFFTKQANDLASASDGVTLKVAQAKADPFHDLKVLFTDEKSVADLAVDHQKIQNEMNIVNRRFSGASSEYNAELSLIQSELQGAAQQRSLTKESLTTSITAAQGLATAISTKTQVVGQQFAEMTLEDMKAELASPTIPNLPRGSLEDAISGKEAILAKLATTRATKGQTKLEQADKLFGVLEEHSDQIPTRTMQAAVDSGKAVFVSELGVTVTPQQAQRVLDKQGASRVAREELTSQMALQSIRSTNAVRNISQQLIRANPSGSDLITIDKATGLATGIDTSVLPVDERDLFSQMQNANALLTALQDQIGSGLQGQELANVSEQAMAMQNLIIKTEKELSALTSKRAGDKYVEKSAKASAAQFNERGVIESPEGAAAIGTELASTLATTAVTSETFGAGWSVGMKSTMILVDAKLQEYAGLHPEVQGETEESDTAQLIATMFSQNKQQDLNLIFRAALKETNSRGDNAIGEIIMQDWLEIGTARSLNHMINTVHVNDPAAQALLQSLLSSDETLEGEITTANDGFSTLFTKLRLLERKAIAEERLSEQSNLVGELQTMLLKDATYDTPFMRDLTTPKKDGAGMLNKLVFDNSSREVFRQSMKQQIMSIPLANIDEAIDTAASGGSILSRAGTTMANQLRFVRDNVLLGDLSNRAFTGLGEGIDEVVDDNRPRDRSVFETAQEVLQNNPNLIPPK